MTPIVSSVTHWMCPNCAATDVTTEARPHVRLHTCPKLHGLTAPMLPAGTRAKVEAVERQDYVGREIVTTDGRGRPIMSVVTTRDDGQDALVFVPSARVTGEVS